MAYIKGCALVDRDHQFKSCASPKPLELAPLSDFPTTPRQRLGRLKGISVTLFLTGEVKPHGSVFRLALEARESVPGAVWLTARERGTNGRVRAD